MDIGSGKNFAIIAKLSSQWLFGFRDPSVAQLIYKKGEGGWGSSSPQLSLASRIRCPLFTRTPISGNVDLRARDFHGESFYDVPALTADPRFRDSMRLITQYSLLSFMTPWQFYYPRVVLQFYHSMTSRGVPSPLEL